MSLLDTQEEIERQVEGNFPIDSKWLLFDQKFELVNVFATVETYEKKFGEISKIIIRKYPIVDSMDGKNTWMYDLRAAGRVGLLKKSGILCTRQDLSDLYKVICDHIARNV